MRFKTGTPARVKKSTINLDVLERQDGDNNILPFSWSTNEDFYIRDIVKRETACVKGCQKWVVFCKNIKELKEMKYNVSNWFEKEVKIFEMHSDLPKEENFKNYTGFCESHRPINVLLTVNKLNEGVHVKGVSGVIMLRETESPIIFLQQFIFPTNINCIYKYCTSASRIYNL